MTTIAHSAAAGPQQAELSSITRPEGLAPEIRRPRKVNTAWMAGFKLKGGPPLGQILSREYHQPARQSYR